MTTFTKVVQNLMIFCMLPFQTIILFTRLHLSTTCVLMHVCVVFVCFYKSRSTSNCEFLSNFCLFVFLHDYSGSCECVLDDSKASVCVSV